MLGRLQMLTYGRTYEQMENQISVSHHARGRGDKKKNDVNHLVNKIKILTSQNLAVTMVLAIRLWSS